MKADSYKGQVGFLKMSEEQAYGRRNRFVLIPNDRIRANGWKL